MFAAAETALNALSTSRLERTLESLAQNRERHRFLELWRDRRTEALTVLLVGHTVANIVAAAVSAVVAQRLLDGTPYGGFALPIAIFSVAFVILSFGEIIPKTYAQNNPEKIVPLTRVVYPISLLLKFATFILTGMTDWIVKKTGGRAHVEDHAVTEEDIEDHIAKAAEQGNLDAEQERLLNSVFQFRDILVKEVMIPRTEMVAFADDVKIDEIFAGIEEEAFSRYPVYKDDLDHVIGVLYARDLLRYFQKRDQGFDIKAFLRDPHFVPETKSILELLRDMQRHRVHMAIVVDEFGGTAGVVTIEDIVEEVFGEIYDETDSEVVGADLVRPVGDGCWEAEGKVSIRDLEDAIDVEFPEDDTYSTVAGFILNQVGKIPEAGSLVRWNGLAFTVLDADEKRVIKVRIDRVEEHELARAAP